MRGRIERRWSERQDQQYRRKVVSLEKGLREVPSRPSSRTGLKSVEEVEMIGNPWKVLKSSSSSSLHSSASHSLHQYWQRNVTRSPAPRCCCLLIPSIQDEWHSGYPIRYFLGISEEEEEEKDARSGKAKGGRSEVDYCQLQVISLIDWVTIFSPNRSLINFVRGESTKAKWDKLVKWEGFHFPFY